MVNCNDVASYGSLALDGSLPVRAALEIGQHLRRCTDCTNYIDQVAKTRALLGIRFAAPATENAGARVAAKQPASPSKQPEQLGYSPLTVTQHQAYLTTLAQAVDPAHADDLVQEAWNHFLAESPTVAPAREDLAAYLVQHLRQHQRDDNRDAQVWADSLLRHHPHNPADLAETDLPADPSADENWRALADLDALDTDADRAELYFPDLYDDGPDTGAWSSPPAAWPSLTRMLSPEEETQTIELYSVLDAALEELPASLGDAVYLVDMEGHSLATASSLLNRDIPDLQHDLAQARNHVRGRVAAYLAVADPGRHLTNPPAEPTSASP